MYTEALDLVKRKEVDAALIDYNVAAWLQEDIFSNDLRVAKLIEQRYHKHIYIYDDHKEHDRIERLLNCFDTNHNYFDHAVDNFARPINIVRLDITDMYYALSNFGITPIMSFLALLTLVLVLMYELYILRKRRCQKGMSDEGTQIVPIPELPNIRLLKFNIYNDQLN